MYTLYTVRVYSRCQMDCSVAVLYTRTVYTLYIVRVYSRCQLDCIYDLEQTSFSIYRGEVMLQYCVFYKASIWTRSFCCVCVFVFVC